MVKLQQRRTTSGSQFIITLPIDVVRDAGLKAGQEFAFRTMKDGLRMVKIKGDLNGDY